MDPYFYSLYLRYKEMYFGRVKSIICSGAAEGDFWHARSGYFASVKGNHRLFLDWKYSECYGLDKKIEEAIWTTFYILIDKTRDREGWERVAESVGYLAEMSVENGLRNSFSPLTYLFMALQSDIIFQGIYNGLGLLKKVGEEGDMNRLQVVDSDEYIEIQKTRAFGRIVKFPQLTMGTLHTDFQKRFSGDGVVSKEFYEYGSGRGCNWRNIHNLLQAHVNERNCISHVAVSISEDFKDNIDRYVEWTQGALIDYIVIVFFLSEYLEMGASKEGASLSDSTRSNFILSGIMALEEARRAKVDAEKAFPAASSDTETRYCRLSSSLTGVFADLPEKAVTGIEAVLSSEEKVDDFVRKFEEATRKDAAGLRDAMMGYLEESLGLIRESIGEIDRKCDAVNASLCDLSSGINYVSSGLDDVSSGLDKVSDGIDGIASEMEAGSGMIRKGGEAIGRVGKDVRVVKFLVIGVMAVAALVGLVALFDRFRPTEDAGEFYRLAVEREAEGKYEEATALYRDAIRVYSADEEKQQLDSAGALNMAMMLMRGKGGLIDMGRAGRYASMAGVPGLEAYICVADGLWDDAVSIRNFNEADTSAYMRLARALIELFNPYERSDSSVMHGATATLYELTDENQVGGEAYESLVRILSDGVYHESGKAAVLPDLYMAFCMANEASEAFNSIRAQSWLVKFFGQWGDKVNSDRFRRLLITNGCDLLDFGMAADVDYSTLSGKHVPEAYLQIAQRNFDAGSRYYGLTGRYFQLADSCFKSNRRYVVSPRFYARYTDMLAEATDLRSEAELLPLVAKSLPDSMRRGVASFIMGMKYSEGIGGVKRDSLLSRECLVRSARLGLPEGKAWLYGVVQPSDSGLASVKGLPLADRLRFLRGIGRGKPYGKELMEFVEANPYDMMSLMSQLKDADLISMSEDDLKNMFFSLSCAFAQEKWMWGIHALSPLLADMSAYLFLSGHADAAWFYLWLSGLSDKMAYLQLFGLSEFARLRMHDLPLAEELMTTFAVNYLTDPDNERVLREKNAGDRVSGLYGQTYRNVSAVKEMVAFLYPELWTKVQPMLTESVEAVPYFESDLDPKVKSFAAIVWEPSAYPELHSWVAITVRPTLGNAYFE